MGLYTKETNEDIINMKFFIQKIHYQNKTLFRKFSFFPMYLWLFGKLFNLSIILPPFLLDDFYLILAYSSPQKL